MKTMEIFIRKMYISSCQILQIISRVQGSLQVYPWTLVNTLVLGETSNKITIWD